MAASDAKPFPKKNEAYRVTFPIFDADGDLVSGAADLDSEISKDGGTFADCTNEATEIATSSGIYYLDLTSTEMNADTVAIIVKTSTSGAKTTPLVMYPVEDGDIPVNVRQIEGADPSDTIRDAVVDDATRIDASALNTLSGHDPGATLSSLTAAQVNAEVDTALADIHLDHLLAADYDPASKPGVATALLNELVESDGGVSRFTANALEEAPTGGSAPTAGEIADAVWDEALADHNTEDSFGNVLNDLVDEDGGGVYQFTANALELAPTGSGSGDWTSGEKEQIRYRLQMDGTQTAPAANAPLQMPVSADAVSQNETAAENFKLWLDNFQTGKITTAIIPTNKSFSTDLSGTETNQYINYFLLFTSGNLIHQIKRINAYQAPTGNKIFYFTTGFTQAPAENDTFIIIPISAYAIIDALTDNGVLDFDQVTIYQTEQLGTQAKADVQAEAAAAIAAVNLDHLVGTATGIPAIPAGTFLDQIMDDGTATFDRSTDSLQAIADNAGGGSLTQQQVRDAMKLAPTAGAPDAGSVDEHLDTIETDAGNAADNVGTAISLDGGTATLAGMLTKMADDNAGADFDAARHSLAEILESFIEAIKAKTDLLTFTGGNVDAIANALGATAKSEVNAEVVDALGTDTIAEMSAGAPTATPTIKQALMYLYMALRNASSSIKTGENTGTRQIKNDAGTTIAQASVSDDGTTFTQGKLGAP